AVMRGRELGAGQECPEGIAVSRILSDALRQERSRLPLRRRLKEQAGVLQRARRELERGILAQDGPGIGRALAMVDPDSAGRAAIAWQDHQTALTLWVSRLWDAADPYETLETFWLSDPIPGAGSWLPAAVLSLRDARSFQPWNERARLGYALL